MLLHFAEMDNPKLAIAGAQVQPAEVGLASTQESVRARAWTLSFVGRDQ